MNWPIKKNTALNFLFLLVFIAANLGLANIVHTLFLETQKHLESISNYLIFWLYLGLPIFVMYITPDKSQHLKMTFLKVIIIAVFFAFWFDACQSIDCLSCAEMPKAKILFWFD